MLWKGDDAGYSAVHFRIAAVRGTPSTCTNCDENNVGAGYEWSLNRARAENLKVSKEGFDYSTRVDDYDRLCIPCHRSRDREHKKTIKTLTLLAVCA